MRKEIACFVVLCEMVMICKGFLNDENEKYVASLEVAYLQNVPENTEDQFIRPHLFVKMKSRFTLYNDVLLTEHGLEYLGKVVEFQVADVSMLVENRIVLITDVPGIIVHCQFSSASSSNAETADSVTAQKLYNSLRATLAVRYLSTHSFSLVSVTKLVDGNGSLAVVSGDEVTMKIHSLEKVANKIMLRFVIELNGRDEPPFLVFTTTNSGVSKLYDKTDEMVLEIWNGLFTRHDVFGYIIKFRRIELSIFAHMFARKFDELLSALSQHYFVTEMGSSSGRR